MRKTTLIFPLTEITIKQRIHCTIIKVREWEYPAYTIHCYGNHDKRTRLVARWLTDHYGIDNVAKELARQKG